MQIWRALRRMLSFVGNIPRVVLGTRVNPDASLRAGTGKFNLNTDTSGNGNFFSADFESIWIQKYYVLFIPFKRCPRQRQRHKINSFCYNFFSCRVMKSYYKNDVNLLRLVIHGFFWQITYSGTSWYNQPLCNEIFDITNDFLYPINSKIYENQPRYNETLL